MVCDKKPASAGFLSFEAHGVQMAGNAWRCCWQWLGVLGAGGLARQAEMFCYNITLFWRQRADRKNMPASLLENRVQIN